MYDSERRFTLSPDDIALLNPNTRTCPIFRSRKDAELTKAIYRRVPVLCREASDGNPEENPWGIRFRQGLFNMTSDSGLFRTRSDLESDGWRLEGNVFHKNGGDCLPLYEAKMVHHFDHCWASYREVGVEDVADAVPLEDKQNPDFHPLPRFWVEAREVYLRCGDLRKRWLLGIRNIARSTDERTVMGGAFPLSAVGHSLSVWTSMVDTATVLPSLLSSVVCDYVARLKIGGSNFNFFIAKQIPVPAPHVFVERTPWSHNRESVRDWLLPRVLELTYTTWELESFASDCGWTGPPFRWDEERRFLLRCELDAAFFHLYLTADQRCHWRPIRQVGGNRHIETPEHLGELTSHFPTPRDAVDYIMDTFPIIRRKDENRCGDFRTKCLILDIYDAMQSAAATGEPYQTVLDPAPADRRCCHQGRRRA